HWRCMVVGHRKSLAALGKAYLKEELLKHADEREVKRLLEEENTRRKQSESEGKLISVTLEAQEDHHRWGTIVKKAPSSDSQSTKPIILAQSRPINGSKRDTALLFAKVWPDETTLASQDDSSLELDEGDQHGSPLTGSTVTLPTSSSGSTSQPSSFPPS